MLWEFLQNLVGGLEAFLELPRLVQVEKLFEQAMLFGR